MDSIQKFRHPNRYRIALREVQFYNKNALSEVQLHKIHSLAFGFLALKQPEGTPELAYPRTIIQKGNLIKTPSLVLRY